MTETQGHVFDLALPADFDAQEPIVRVFCDIDSGEAPCPCCLPSSGAFADPGSAPECDVLHVYIDRGDHAEDLLPKLPVWVRDSLCEQALEQWLYDHQRRVSLIMQHDGGLTIPEATGHLTRERQHQ